MTKGSTGNSLPATINSNRLILDLRRGVKSVISKLNLAADCPKCIEHVVLRQIDPLWIGTLDEDNDGDQQHLMLIFHGIAQLEHLKTITISEFDQPPAIPAACLTMLLESCLDLIMLKLDAIWLSAASNEDISRLAAALQYHPALQSVHFSGFATESGTSASSCFASIARALSQVPTLEEVEIVETSFQGAAWNGEALGELCQSSSLQVLRVRGVRCLGSKDIAIMAQALHTSNTTMKELWILSCNSMGEDEGDWAYAAESIGDLLTTNNSLVLLGLNCVTEQHALAIAKALETNQTLRGLHLCLADGLLSKSVCSAYANLLKEHNYALEKLSGSFGLQRARHHDTCNTQGITCIDFFLALNKNGRRLLLQNDLTKREWLEALALQGNDSSALFYWLSHNPSLCSLTD